MFIELRRKFILWRIGRRIRSNTRMIDRSVVWFAKHPVEE